MGHEQAPNILPLKEHKVLQQEIKDVAQVAREADRAALDAGVRFPDRHNDWVDTSHDSTRMLGQTGASHRIQNRDGGGRTDVYIRDRQDDTRRKVHSYTDRRYGEGHTGVEMDIKRPGQERKVLRSDNPAVHKMLTRIALKNIEQSAKEDIDKYSERRAA